MWICADSPASNEGLRKSTNDREGNYDAASGRLLIIGKGFQRGKQNLYTVFTVFFSTTMHPKNIKNQRLMDIQCWLNFLDLQNKCSSGDPGPLKGGLTSWGFEEFCTL